MHYILIIGAGRSSSELIKYLHHHIYKDNLRITVTDKELDPLRHLSDDINLKEGDITDEFFRSDLISKADLVISMLPAFMHPIIAQDCLLLKKHLLTASYLNQDLYPNSRLFEDSDLLFLGETGLDPGIDHMSAMKILNGLKSKGAKIISFRSFTGGLIAPESDDNPWHYKITWNPRNVVLAGQSTSQCKLDGILRIIPHHRVFRYARSINIPAPGKYEMYPNRDSLQYLDLYGLQGVETLIRGTIRYKGFCEAWQKLVMLGLTSDNDLILDSGEITYRDWIRRYIPECVSDVDHCFKEYFNLKNDDPIMEKCRWLGLFDDKAIGINKATSAQILEQLIREKWKMKEDDKDMIIMHHEVEYQMDGEFFLHRSTLVEKGMNRTDTAMSRLVGLPLGIAARLILQNKFSLRGMHIPIHPEIYEPILIELEQRGVRFKEETLVLT